MKEPIGHMEAEGITSDYVAKLGEDLFKAMVDAASDDDLLALPRIERVRQESERRGEKRGELRGEKRGELKGEAKLLQRQPFKKFNHLSSWASEAIKAADSKRLEVWGDRVLDASSIEEIFSKQEK
ncbi:hypothetical protein ACQZV8_07810 [Magnetococcales bacterium HHB-1]